MQTNKTTHKPMDFNMRQNMRESFGSNNASRIKSCIAGLELGKALTDLDDRGTPLMYAAWRGYYTAAGLLLEKSPVKNDIDYVYETHSALKLAAKGSDVKHFNIVKLLIANGATVTADIKEAARQGNNPQTIALLEDSAAMENLRANPPTLMSAPTTYSATRESSCAIL